MKKLASLLSALAALFAISALTIGLEHTEHIVIILAAMATAAMSFRSAALFAGELSTAMKLLSYGMVIVAISWFTHLLSRLFEGQADTLDSIYHLTSAIALVVLTIGFYRVYKVAASVAEGKIGHPEGPGE